MNQNPWVIAVIVVVVFSAGSYYLGKQSSSPTATAGTGTYAGRTGGPGGAGRFGSGTAGSGITAGTILSMGTNSMTIQMMQSTSTSASTGTKIILFDSNTQISEMKAVAPTSLVAGQTVVVNGSKNSDGSVTASTIQVRPERSAGTGPTSPPPGYNK